MTDRAARIRQLLDALPLTLAQDRTTLAKLDLITSVIEEAELYRAELVIQARQVGESWTLIGQNIGCTKQAAHKRYASIVTGPRGRVLTESTRADASRTAKLSADGAWTYTPEAGWQPTDTAQTVIGTT